MNYLAVQLFDTSMANISMHTSNTLKDSELDQNSVVKNYLTTELLGRDSSIK